MPAVANTQPLDRTRQSSKASILPTLAAPRYLTNDETAQVLRLSPRTLEKLRIQGGGPRFRKFGRRVMYSLADIEAWADAQVYEMTADPEYQERHPPR
ncbi:helix-turn-helix transcriptional regulator [Alcaligenes faecalis]|uniref:helix-turn-helix transcriptional regulator n=1 Tax=Alcaligenes faecalis TaxID=511 RepID=UPI001EF1056F|nr:helix-turn-helix domain-containing protein [Alcaligenes faecalis]ULH06454.1 helix-turn-helix domain-containing protein [Alcaligenes faecalis]